MTIKTFRGLIIDGAADTIVLHTNDGSMGYRIVKLQAMPQDPGDALGEHMIKIYKISTNPDVITPTSTVDFSDNTLIGAASVSTHSGNLLYNEVIIIDREIFNQDIYITHVDRAAAASCNYYIELEQVKLDLNENTVATLKDIRNLA